MNAYSSVSGAVIFIPDEIASKDSKSQPVSYRSLLEEETKTHTPRLFGQRTTQSHAIEDAA